MKNLLCARNSPSFFNEHKTLKSIHLGAYFGIMHTVKVKLLCNQICNNLRSDIKKKMYRLTVCCSWVTILNKLVRLGLIEVPLNKELICLEEQCFRLREQASTKARLICLRSNKNARVAEMNEQNGENYEQRDQRDYEELDHVGLCRPLWRMA